MEFDELMALLINPGDDAVVPDTIYDDLSNHYHGSAAALTEKDEKIKSLEAECSELRYQLAVNAGEDKTTQDDIAPDDEAPEDITIDDLFDDGKES